MANRVLLGLRSGTYGAFVSRPGQDVLTAADGQLMFDSRQRGLYVVARGTISIPAANSTGSVSFANVGAPPIVECYRSFYSGYLGTTVVAKTLGKWTITVTASGITFTRNDETGAQTFSYIVYGVPV